MSSTPPDAQNDDNPTQLDAPPPTRSKNISALFSNPSTRPVIFLTLIGVVVVSVVVVAKIRGGNNTPPDISGASIAPPPEARVDSSLTPTPKYVELAQKDAAKGAQSAAETGKSYIPAVDLGKTPPPPPTPSPQQAAQPAQPEFVSYTNPPASNPNRDRIIATIQSRLNELNATARAPSTHSVVRVDPTTPGEAGPKTILKMGPDGNRLETVDASGSPIAATPKTPLVKAGTMLYATTDLEINTDYPAPTIVSITSGPLKGARLIGAPQLTRDAVVLAFRSMSLPPTSPATPNGGGSTVAVSAFAIDQNTDSNALATSVDKHYLSRYGALLSAALLRGYSDAYARSGATVTATAAGTVTTYGTVSNKQIGAQAGGEVGRTVADAVGQNFNRPPTVRVARGTPIAILFTDDVMPGAIAQGTPPTTQPQVTASVTTPSNPVAIFDAPTPAVPSTRPGVVPASPAPQGGNPLLPLPPGALTSR